jgi:hypothetical protein
VLIKQQGGYTFMKKKPLGERVVIKMMEAKKQLKAE